MSDVQSLLETAQAGVISGAASAKSAFDAVDFCMILTLLNDAASDLVGLKAQVLSVDYETLHEGIVATTAAATTSMLVGIALLLLPVLLGRNWLDVALAILACFLGSVGTCLLLAREQVLFDSTTAALGIVGEAKCGLQITLIAAATIACGIFTTRLFALIMFATGTLGAGYVGFVGLELIMPLVPADYQQLATSNALTYAAVGFIGLLGGYVLATCGKPFINAVLGLLGAALTAQGGMKILLTDIISPETAAHMQADQYYTCVGARFREWPFCPDLPPRLTRRSFAMTVAPAAGTTSPPSRCCFTPCARLRCAAERAARPLGRSHSPFQTRGPRLPNETVQELALRQVRRSRFRAGNRWSRFGRSFLRGCMWPSNDQKVQRIQKRAHVKSMPRARQ